MHRKCIEVQNELSTPLVVQLSIGKKHLVGYIHVILFYEMILYYTPHRVAPSSSSQCCRVELM